MKKKSLPVLLFFLPFFSFAQPALSVIKDFKKSTLGVSASYKIRDNVNIVAIQDEWKAFEYVALNDKMEILWRFSIVGRDLGAGNFKGKTLIVTEEYKHAGKGYIRSYKGYLVNTETGKVEKEKEIYSNEGKLEEEVKCFFSNDGSSFRMTIRETKHKNTGSIRIVGLGFGEKNLFEKTTNFTVVDINDKLEIQSQITPKLPDTFVGSTINYNGDLFLASFSAGGVLNIAKYRPGTDQASAPIGISLDLRDKSDKDEPYVVMDHLKLTPSAKNNNVVYAAVYERNDKKEYQLTIGKFDFNNNTKQVSTEEFSKAHLKEIGRNFESLNTPFKTTVLDEPGAMKIEYFKEAGNTLLALLHKQTVGGSASDGGYIMSGSFLINGYDADAKERFETVMPGDYIWRVPFASSFYVHDNDFYITVGGRNSGIANVISSIYGDLDLTNGKWKKLERLTPNEQLSSSARKDCTIWYQNSFIVPFFKVGMMIRGDLSLQQYSY